MNDATEIIRYYQWQIHVKRQRAIDSASTEETLNLDEFPKDSDGSAKVALIGIDRSISAWKVLLSLFPEQAREILHFIATLEHIIKSVEIQFPNARDFIRPGFDDIIQSDRNAFRKPRPSGRGRGKLYKKDKILTGKPRLLRRGALLTCISKKEHIKRLSLSKVLNENHRKVFKIVIDIMIK